jgi:phage terminase large subunit
LQTLRDTRAFDPETTLAEARARGMPEPLIRQEYLCDWTAANVGSVFGDLLELLERRGGVCEYAHPTDGVFVNFDLGISDSTAMWAWRIADGFDCVNYYQASGKPLSHFFEKLSEWGYRYVKLFLPHDARARNLLTGSSVLERFVDEYGSAKVAMVPHLSLLDGIEAARWLLQQKARFHSRCAEGLEALRAYRYDWDEDRKTFGKKPLHDWSSHGADAFRYSAVVVKVSQMLVRAEPEQEKRPPAVGTSELPPLDELWETLPVRTRV